jgi:endoribonuclease Dicer
LSFLQALGDLIESIAGALLIDTKFNLDGVWRIFKPLLSPIVTPEKLELPPLRELVELCDSIGVFVKEKCTKKAEMVRAQLWVQLDNELLSGEGYEKNRKAAKGKAASCLLKKLQVCTSGNCNHACMFSYFTTCWIIINKRLLIDPIIIKP